MFLGRPLNRESTLSFRDKWFYHISILTIVFTGLFVLYFFYLLIFPLKIMEIKSFKTKEDSYRRGEAPIFIMDYCKYANISGHVEPELINGIHYILDDFGTSLPVGCKVVDYLGGPIAEEIPPGKYKFKFTLIYKVNVLRTVRYEYLSNQFEILP